MANENAVELSVTINVPGKKAITFRFCGGPRDGQEVRSDDEVSSKHRINEAIMYWLVTANGEMGSQFPSLSPRAMEILATEGYEEARQQFGGPLRKYRYEVIQKRESLNELTVVCQFIGEGW
ncbi:MAG TPA: hypothetical protein VJ828_11310 [Lacipirellulaceae bacterium]|nr:hypothetical protein [Lacipirellulaceae bacterium]